MAKLTVQATKELAKSIIASHPGGIRYSHLVAKISTVHPETPLNTIHGAVWNLDALFPSLITKPSRGLFKPASVPDEPEPGSVAEKTTETTPTGKKVYESEFYEPFAQWLKTDLDEVTVVTPLGGAGLKTKWGTPDVIGVYKPLASNLVKFPLEIISAEIKIDPQTPVVAFGQAVAYRFFSSKTYIAMPSTLTEEDQGRLEALCMLFGVGLVLFDLNALAPNFAIRVRAQRFPPDMFYVNEFADRLKAHDHDTFEKLFG
ncbi:MAG TPA: hypothetical protein VIM11_27325 [Tepidisphaeraceae bacterium]|jgi:hypothetical protein